MDDAQTWTIIAGFLGILTVGMGAVLRVVQVEIRSVGQRLDALDRDVQRLYEHVFKDRS